MRVVAMPKVGKEYFADKENAIIAAAVRVCESKPAYAVTLRDIAREAKISTGGMYNYFTSIDEIFAKIINMAHDELSFANELINIFDSDMPPEQIISKTFAIVGRMMDSLHKRFGNLISELAHLYMADDERRRKLEELTRVNDELAVFYRILEDFIDKGVVSHRFKPNVRKEQILFLIANMVEGIDDGVGFIKDNAKRFGIEIKQGAEAEKTMIVLGNIVVELLNIGKPETCKETNMH